MLLLFALAAQPALAWTFTPGSICRLDHQFGDISVNLTYDPAAPLYSISLERTAPFPLASPFSITFKGRAPLQITTDRHVLSQSKTRLTVTDTGFGNVLNGLQFNATATARLGAAVIVIPLEGAADPVAAFRACKAAPPTA